MKKTKNLLSLLLCAAMSAGGLYPAALADTATEKTKGVVFSEGFEDWEVGTLYDTAGSYTVGNLKFDLKENDKLEIAVNDYGNKALKITKGSTENTTLRYVFPKQYSGEVNITFDFLSEHNSRHFSEFGNLEYTAVQNSIYKYTHYQDSLYIFSNPSRNSLKNAMSSTQNGGYVQFSTTYNTRAEQKIVSFGYTRNQTKADDKGGDTNEYSVESTTAGIPEKIYGIRWTMGTKDGYSGTDAATSEGDKINAGIYWIDNIVVKVDSPVLSDSFDESEEHDEDAVLKAGEDFEGYTGDIVYKGGRKAWQKYFTFNFLQGDSAEITTDPVTNSKALKITKSASSSESALEMSFGEVSDKVVKLSYDVRFQNHSRYLQKFPQIFDVSGSQSKLGLLYREQFFWDALGSANGGTVVANTIRSADNRDEYVKFEYTIDLKNKKIYTSIDSDTAVMKSTVSDISSNSIGKIKFGMIDNANRGTDTDGTEKNNGVYWIDNLCLEIVSLELESSSIANGETKVPARRNLVLKFNESVSGEACNAFRITKNDDAEILENGIDYTVELSDDAKTVTVIPTDGEWEYETQYNVSVSEISGELNIVKYPGTSISFTTDEFSTVLLSDYFENYTVDQKWEGPQTVKTGNITFRLADGDSAEYAYDKETGLYGFKLIKSNTDGDLDFVYSFPSKYTDGKYMVKVDERIQNHSKGHRRWPALLSDSTSGEIYRMGLRPASYWLQQTGTFGVDRYGVDHSSTTNGRYIASTNGNARTVVFGELSTGAGIRFGLYKPATDTYVSSLEPAVAQTTLGGVLMRMTSGGSTNYSDCYECGTQVDSDTENNPNNDGIAWIYGVTVERVTLSVKNTSFKSCADSFDPADEFTVNFNYALDVNTVNTNNIELYENGEQISAYEYTVNMSSDGKTVTINPVAGIKFDTTYKINISNAVAAEDSQVAKMNSSKSYTVQTMEYEDTEAPDIIWSSIPNGSENIDPSTESIYLSTDNVYIAESTINKEAIKVYENGAEFDDYTVEAYGFYAIKLTFGKLNKESTYKIVVSGLLSGGSEALKMTADYETSFKTRADIYAANVTSKISADGGKSQITAELFNKSGENINYQLIGVLKAEDGKILSVNYGSNGTLSDDNACDVEVSADADSGAEYFDLYIWDSVGGMYPLTKKQALSSVNEKTYGYDNYIDSEKALTVSYIGGSITQQLQYTTPLTEKLDTFLKQDNEDRRITYSVQGLGGTNSLLGLYRLEKDVAAKKPDIVFIEFAVNDSDTTTAARTQSMEGMIRKLMKLDHQPMIILLDLTTKNYASLGVISDWNELMTEYGIGYVNVAQYIKDNEATEENPGGLYVWTDNTDYPNAAVLTSDGTHPNAAGGAVYAEYIFDTIKSNPENYFKKMTYKEDTVSGYEYSNPRMISWNKAEYDANWKTSATQTWTFYDGVAEARSAGAKLTFTFTGTTIGLFVPKSKTGTTATYSIDDGAYTGTVSCYGNVSTDMPMMSLIRNDLEDGVHTITLTVDEADDVNFRFGYFIAD